MISWGLTILAALFFAARTAAMKMVATDVPPAEALFLQNGIALILWLPFAGVARLTWPKEAIMPHLVHAFAEGSMLFVAYILLMTMPTERVTLMTLWGPLFIPIMLWVWYAARVPNLQRWGLVVGWLGLAVICFVTQLGSLSDRLLGIALGLFAATALITNGQLRTQDNLLRIVFWAHLLPAIAFFFLALPGWVWPSGPHWGLLALIGLLSLAFELLLFRASRPGQPYGGLIYTAILFSMAADWIFWNYLPRAWFIIGGLLAIIGCSLIVTSQGRKSGQASSH